VEVIDKRRVDLRPSVLQRSETVWRDPHFTGLDSKRLRDIGGRSKDGAAFGIDFHGRVDRNRWIERWADFVVEILALEAVSD
jgi:hypothetical protein